MVKTLGTKIETPNKVIVELRDGAKYQFSKTIQGLVMPEGINPSEYAMIGSVRIENGVAVYDASSAISMVQRFNDKQYLPAHVDVLNIGLFVSTPKQFLPHVRNVNDALRGKGVLYDAAGNLIEEDRLVRYAHILNHNHWAYHNAGFKEGSGFLDLDLVTISGLDDEGNPVKKSVPLESCLEESGWAELESLNSQGFPTRKALIEEYAPGKTFYFVKPKKDLVAGSDADGSRLILCCDRSSLGRVSSLGVFPVFLCW